MKIIKSTGCTAFYTDIDGIELSELSEDKKKDILNKLINEHLKYGIDNTINMLLDNIETNDVECSEPCESCGDTVYRNIYIIEE